MAPAEPAASRSSRPPHAGDRAGECAGPDILVPADLWICRPDRRNGDVRCSTRRVRTALLGAGGFLTSSPGDHYSLRRAKPDEGSRKGKRPCFAGRQILHVTKNSPSAIVLVWSLVLAMYAEARAQESAGDPSVMCERAALQAERDWRLPQGLLAAIGLAESGRRIQA